MKRVWITRAAPGAETTAERVRAMGLEPLIAPLIETAAVDGPPIDLAGIGALAFTSAAGAAAFAARSAERALPVFAVGGATARAARGLGFPDVVSADGDVTALARLIAARGPIGGAVLHAAAAEPAGDLAGDLSRLGVPARAVTVYETRDVAPPEAMAGELPALDAVLLHSPRAARGLAAWVAEHPAPRLAAVCLSEAVAAPLLQSMLRSISAAKRPEESALLAALAGALAEPGA